VRQKIRTIYESLGHPLVTLIALFVTFYCIAAPFGSPECDHSKSKKGSMVDMLNISAVQDAIMNSNLEGLRTSSAIAGQKLIVDMSSRPEIVKAQERLDQVGAKLTKNQIRVRRSIVHRALIPRIPASPKQLLAFPFAKRIIVSERSKVMFCPIPKAANSNFKMLLRKFEGFTDYLDLARAHNPHTSGFKFLTDFPEEKVQQMMDDPTYFKFIFVRNPFVRALSCYLNKFASKSPATEEFRIFLGQLVGWDKLQDKGNLTEADRPTFGQFVDAVWEQAPEQMNEHWAIQSQICGLGIMPYDFVGRFELNVTAEAQIVLDALDKSYESFPSPDEIRFGSSDSLSRANDYYTPEIEQKVLEIFHRDFVMLNYHRDRSIMKPGKADD